MAEKYFNHPRRFPLNVVAPFYTTGHPRIDGGMTGDCLVCHGPEHEAPELLAELDDNNSDTYFVRQPENFLEIEKACNAIKVCCVVALRYGGRQKFIIRMLGNSPEFCDYLINDDDEFVLCVDKYGELLPFAQDILDDIIKRRTNQ